MAAADPQPESRIFISYRREDSSGHVLALLPALRAQFGADRIFKDTDNIPAGVDFVKFIKRELDTCAVLLAIIGRDWLTVQDPRLKKPRLDNPQDFLRVEVATALKNDKIRVIPVLVERGTMPAAEDLPADLIDLTHRNAIELSDVRWESDVRRLIEAIQRTSAAVPVEKAEPPAQRPELQNLQKRRAREIATHLAAARDAFATNDYEAALWACEKALVLDPQNSDAIEFLDRARKAIDQQKIDGWLNQARTSLSQGDLANASELIDQALSLEPASDAGLTLRQELLKLRREREHDRERARLVDAAIARARASVDEEDFESAVQHAEDALALAPESAVAEDVRSKAVVALDERRRLREHKRQAQQAVADARGKFAVGEHDAGLRLLRDFSPAHDLVSQALLELQQEADAKAGLAAAVAAEAARRAVDARLAEASSRFQQQDYLGARQLVEVARSHDPQHPDVARWLGRVEAAIAEQAAAVQRADAIRRLLARGRASLEREEFPAAIRDADELLGIDPDSADARQVRDAGTKGLQLRIQREEQERLAQQAAEKARVEAARLVEERRQADARARERDEAERRQKALVIAIAGIESSLAAGRLDEAEKLLAAAENGLPASPDIAALRHRAKALRDREVLRAHEARIQQLLGEAQSALAAKQFKSAKRTAAAILELAPDNDIARSVLTAATRELRAGTVEFWKTRGGWGLAAAVVVLGTAGGVWYYSQAPSSPPEATQSVSKPGPASAPVTSSPTQSPVPAPAPPQESPLAKPPEAKTPTPEETRQQRLELLRGRARSQMQQRLRLQALETVAEGLQIEPGDAALLFILDSLLDEAQRTAERTKTAATNAGAAVLPQPAFTEARNLEDQATRARAANKKDEAIRSFWKAAERFSLAARHADASARARLADEQAARKEKADEQAGQKQPKEDPARQKPFTPPQGQPPREETKTAENRPPPVTDKSAAGGTPKPLVATREEELKRVAASIRRFEAAYDSLNAGELKAVYPSSSVDLSDFRSYDIGIVIQTIDISEDGMSATVVANVSHDFRGQVGSPRHAKGRQTFTLQKQGSAWIITQVQRR